MVTHLVLLKPRPDLPSGDRASFVAAFERAIREIPTVASVRIGLRIRHGASYENEAPDAADFMAAIDFDGVTGLQAYLAHPAHAELGRLFGEVLSSALIYDFEVGGLEMLATTTRG